MMVELVDRMTLYEQGLTDKEIAEKVGCTLGAVWSWRFRKKLKTHRIFKPIINKPLRNHKAKVSFRKALPEYYHDDILRFLYMVDHYKPNDTVRFMTLWRDGVIQ